MSTSEKPMKKNVLTKGHAIVVASLGRRSSANNVDWSIELPVSRSNKSPV